MQPTTSDPSHSPAPPGSDDLVRAARDGGVDAAFRPALDAAEALHRHMVRARVVSARMVALQRSEKVAFHHASLGEEAAVAGAVLAMRATDWVFPGAREWYATLARGLPLDAYVHHAFGSASDPAKGHAAPDHAPARAFNVVPPSGVVGAHLPQAVGAAWAAKIRGDDVAALALFGAEVSAGGDFHNALNFAGVFKVPIVLACRAPADARVASRAVAYGLANARVDGGDALAVFTVVKAALARAASGEGATLVEIVSPVLDRLGGDALTDAALVSSEVLDLGPADPLTRLRAALAREDRLAPGAHEAIAREASAELDAAVAAAERAGPPAPATIFDHVYAGVPAHLAAERERLAGTQRNGG
ncbi:MAG: hypothetical protein KF850_18345 [Labilithrix sp.]|nr:hypothetical protein [Labilithrix sp.]